MTTDPQVPAAVLKPKRRLSPAWLIPVAALALAAWLGVKAWSERGVIVYVTFDEGHGLKAGDEVRYRGIAVGEVRAIELASSGVRVTASLRGRAGNLARGGSRFWVVRPQLELSRIAGLETLVGPRYVAVLPGGGRWQRHFVGLKDPPVVESQEPGDLEVILTATERGTLRRGAPVTFRQVTIGTVLSVGLSSDGGAVEARLHVNRAYAQLIREGSRFWEVGGLEASVGITGLNVELRSLEALLSGGVAMATPPDAGEAVRTGQRFTLETGPPDGWVKWQPLVVIGSALLPPAAPLPSPLRARIGWRQGWFNRARSRQGWVLPTDRGLLGPLDLLGADEGADPETAVLEVAGTVVPLSVEPVWAAGGLALSPVHLDGAVSWPLERRRDAQQPEDCLAVGDPTASPLPLAAARLFAADGAWKLDPAVSVDESWHGAAVLARADGLLLGLLLVDDDEARVALVPEIEQATE